MGRRAHRSQNFGTTPVVLDCGAACGVAATWDRKRHDDRPPHAALAKSCRTVRHAPQRGCGVPHDGEINISELARRLGVDRRTIQRRMRRGWIPPVLPAARRAKAPAAPSVPAAMPQAAFAAPTMSPAAPSAAPHEAGNPWWLTLLIAAWVCLLVGGFTWISQYPDYDPFHHTPQLATGCR